MELLTFSMDVLKKNHAEFIETISSIGQEVRRQKGCEGYNIYRNVERDTILHLESCWSSKDSLKAYIGSRNFSITLGAIKTFSVLPEIHLGGLKPTTPEELMEKF